MRTASGVPTAWRRSGLGLMAAVLLMTGTGSAQAQDAKGDWQGTLMVGTTKLRLAVHLSAAADHQLRGTMDSLDQNANGMALADITAGPDTLSFKVPVIAGAFAGRWDKASSTWAGTWSQAGMSLPLSFAAGGPPPAPATKAPTLPANWAVPSDGEIAPCSTSAYVSGRAKASGSASSRETVGA